MGYEAIVIGSGVSGLTAAIVLAKEGRQVLVLEQHSRPGGLMQNFRRGPYLFPTGVHRLGSLDEGQILWRYFKYLGVLDSLDLVRMSPEGFEEYCFPGLTFKVPHGHEAFRESLHRLFPAEQALVDRFFADMQETVSQFALYNLLPRAEWPRLDWEAKPLTAYLDDFGASRELKGILTAINPLYGVPPSECPLYTHFLVMDSFLKSSWRVDEHRTPLAEAFAGSLRAHGGELRCGALVEGVDCRDGQARGVRLAGGEYLPAELVIFTGHPRQLLHLCPPGAFRPAFKSRLSDSQDTYAPFAVAFSWRHPNCSLAQCDTFIYNNWDTGQQYEQRLVGTSQRPGMVYCSALPRSVAGSFSGVAMIGMAALEMAPFEGTRRQARSQDYREAKGSVAARIFDTLKERWPERAGDLEMVEACSPLTYRDYTLTPRGTAYGVIKTVSSFRHSRFTAATKIKGLLLAGQSIILPGVLGALISGVHAGTVVLGQDYLVGKIVKETR